MGLLFLTTGFLNRKFEQHERRMSREWYERGERELAAGRAEAALDPLRTALVYSRNDPRYELRLGEALVAAQHYAEAKTYLLTLWERQPGSAALNLELARLAARRGEIAEATHYYEASLYGVWESNGEQQRRAARRELIAYLLSHGRSAEAVAHTISFAANLPPDPRLHVEAGELFMKEESYDHATEQFREALLVEPHNSAALAGAGRAAFEGGDYLNAERYLEQAIRAAERGGGVARLHLQGGDSALAELLALVRSALSLDAFASGLSARERGSRAMRAFTLAQSRLAACAAPAGSSGGAQLSALSGQAEALEPKLHKDRLLRDMDLFTETVNFGLDAEKAAEAVCGPGSVDDRALALLAARPPGGAR